MDDPLEIFRNNFFDTLQKEKEEKERVLKQKQRSCWHNYVVGNNITYNNILLQIFNCKKCNHVKLKKLV